MGKGILVAGFAVAVTTMLLLSNTYRVSSATAEREADHQASSLTRDMALAGRKLVLASWIESGGTAALAPFASINQDGGRIEITDYTLNSGVLDFTVRAEMDTTVHEVRSQFEWTGFNLNAFQLKTADLTASIDPNATLNFNQMILDDLSIQDLDEVLIQQLGLGGSLSEFGLGMAGMTSALQTELAASGNSGVQIDIINQADRDAFDLNAGLYFPDQVVQSVTQFAKENPTNVLSVSPENFANSASSFANYDMVKVTGDLTFTENLTGSGILVVEGDLIVPPGKQLHWDGLVVTNPPATNMQPKLDLSGDVDLNGGLVAAQEGMPNTGHMDLSIYRDMSGQWASPFGAEKEDFNILKHTHDYTSVQGNYVVFHSDNAGQPNHQFHTRFDETLGLMSPSDEIFFEIQNPSNHGRSLLSIETNAKPAATFPVSAGFGPTYMHPVNVYRTSPMQVSELRNLDLIVTRLSALQRMWDDSENPYPGCTYAQPSNGPGCVWSDYNRYQGLTLRMYKMNGSNETLVYAASMYWHRREDEEEEFEQEMNELLNHIQSPDYGLHLTLGPQASITGDAGAIASLTAFGGTPIGLTHLGTWHRHWEPQDSDNPMHYVSSQ